MDGCFLRKMLPVIPLAMGLAWAVYAFDSPPQGGGGGGTTLTIAEEDASPSSAFSTLKVTNGRLTDNGDGTASLNVADAAAQPFKWLRALDGIAPASNAATLSATNELRHLNFDDTTQETTEWPMVLPNSYAGGGLTVTVYWRAASATSGSVTWEASIWSITDDADDTDTDGFAAANFTTTTTASAAGEVKETEITFTDGADMDSWAAGEFGRIKIERDADGSSGTDDMVGDAQVFGVLVEETSP